MSVEAPSLLSYPHILHLNEVPELRKQYVYLVKKYPMEGISVLTYKKDDVAAVQIGDWDGRPLRKGHPLQSFEQRFMKNYLNKFMELARISKIHQVILYLSCDETEMRLVDARIAMDNMASPGFIKDVFGSIMPSQEIVDILVFEGDYVKKQANKQPPFDQDLILKPSKFKTIIRRNQVYPMYGRTWA